MWFEAYTVIEGAYDAEKSFRTVGAAERWLKKRLRGAKGKGYIIEHYCKKNEECECVQWLTDHNPIIDTEEDSYSDD